MMVVMVGGSSESLTLPTAAAETPVKNRVGRYLCFAPSATLQQCSGSPPSPPHSSPQESDGRSLGGHLADLGSRGAGAAAWLGASLPAAQLMQPSADLDRNSGGGGFKWPLPGEIEYLFSAPVVLKWWSLGRYFFFFSS